MNLVVLAVGRRDWPGMIARGVLGVGVALWIVVYGLACIATQQATIVARGGLTQVIGLPATSLGIGYVALGIAAYVFVCWDGHPRFGGLRDAALQVLLIVMALSLAATFGLALI